MLYMWFFYLNRALVAQITHAVLETEAYIDQIYLCVQLNLFPRWECGVQPALDISVKWYIRQPSEHWNESYKNVI